MGTLETRYIKWESELHLTIPPETWTEVCMAAHRVTCSNSWREFRWKMVVRFFSTPHITGKYGLASSSSCWRECGETDSNFLHTFWSCERLRKYWDDIFSALTDIFRRDIPKEPLYALLGAAPLGFECRDDMYLLQILLVAADHCKWVKTHCPNISVLERSSVGNL